MAFKIFIQVFQLASGSFFGVFSQRLGFFFRFFGPQVVSVGRRVNFRFSVGFQDFYSGFSVGF